MKKTIKRGLLTMALCMALAGVSGTSVLAANFNLSGKIAGNMVRLRTTPYNGVVLGLMEKDEVVMINSENLEEQYSCGCAHLKRVTGEGAGQIGWTVADFVRCPGYYS